MQKFLTHSGNAVTSFDMFIYAEVPPVIKASRAMRKINVRLQLMVIIIYNIYNNINGTRFVIYYLINTKLLTLFIACSLYNVQI